MAKTARRILAHLHSTDAELSILLVGDMEIRKINREYRKIDRPTDVIAFAMREGEFGEINSNVLGDVVISLDTAKKQALERGEDVMDELSCLLIHGILHLDGYNHEGDEDESIKMKRKEREIRKALGISVK